MVEAALGFFGGGGPVGRGPRLSEARRLDESCPSESDMYAEPLSRRGFEIRSACPRLLVPPWFDGRMGGATREFKSCRLQVENSALTRSVTRHAEPPAPEAPHSIPFLVLRLLPEERRLANQAISPAAYCTQRRIRPSCSGFKFACLGPRRSSNLVPILGTLIDVRRSTFELALQIDRSVPPGALPRSTVLCRPRSHGPSASASGMFRCRNLMFM